MEMAKVSYKKIGETEIFTYLKENKGTAEELYHALAGIDADQAGQIELREKADRYFLAKEGGATFAFLKPWPDNGTAE